MSSDLREALERNIKDPEIAEYCSDLEKRVSHYREYAELRTKINALFQHACDIAAKNSHRMTIFLFNKILIITKGLQFIMPMPEIIIVQIEDCTNN